MGSNVLCLAVRPHIRRYLDHLVSSGPSAELDAMLHVLERTLRIELTQTLPRTPLTFLHLVYRGRTPSRTRQQRAAYLLECRYRQRCHAWLDQVRSLHQVSIMGAITLWRERHGITEDDLAWETSRMAYVRYRAQRGALLPRGGRHTHCSLALVI